MKGRMSVAVALGTALLLLLVGLDPAVEAQSAGGRIGGAAQ